MRGDDQETGSMFSYRSLEDRIPRNHPLRPMRAMVDEALADVSPRRDPVVGPGGEGAAPGIGGALPSQQTAKEPMRRKLRTTPPRLRARSTAAAKRSSAAC
jgi:hypothetical protein